MKFLGPIATTDCPKGKHVSSDNPRKASIVAAFKRLVPCTKVTLLKAQRKNVPNLAKYGPPTFEINTFTAHCMKPAAAGAKTWHGGRSTFESMGYYEITFEETRS